MTPGGINNAVRRVTPGKRRTDGQDAPTVDNHVCRDSGCTGAIEHEPAGNNQIHGRALRSLLAAGAHQAEEQQAEQPALVHASCP